MRRHRKRRWCWHRSRQAVVETRGGANTLSTLPRPAGRPHSLSSRLARSNALVAHCGTASISAWSSPLMSLRTRSASSPITIARADRRVESGLHVVVQGERRRRGPGSRSGAGERPADLGTSRRHDRRREPAGPRRRLHRPITAVLDATCGSHAAGCGRTVGVTLGQRPVRVRLAVLPRVRCRRRAALRGPPPHEEPS